MISGVSVSVTNASTLAWMEASMANIDIIIVIILIFTGAYLFYIWSLESERWKKLKVLACPKESMDGSGSAITPEK